MGILNRLFGIPDKAELKKKLENGAILLDVRTIEEFRSGSVKGSVNIPISDLPSGMKKLNKDKSIVAVCESGARSAQAVRFLKQQGYDAYNGGGWNSYKQR